LSKGEESIIQYLKPKALEAKEAVLADTERNPACHPPSSGPRVRSSEGSTHTLEREPRKNKPSEGWLSEVSVSLLFCFSGRRLCDHTVRLIPKACRNFQ
ncbi:mCG144918, partial [Mus musculus]